MGDAAALCQQAMMSALAGAARSTRVFLDDLQTKAKRGEPNGDRKQDNAEQIIEEEQKLKALAACIAPQMEATQSAAVVVP